MSAAAVAGAAFTVGLAPLTLVVGFLGVVALAHDACRFVLTEGCLTRLQQIITTTKVLHTAPDRAIPAGQRTPLIGA